MDTDIQWSEYLLQFRFLMRHINSVHQFPRRLEDRFDPCFDAYHFSSPGIPGLSCISEFCLKPAKPPDLDISPGLEGF